MLLFTSLESTVSATSAANRSWAALLGTASATQIRLVNSFPLRVPSFLELAPVLGRAKQGVENLAVMTIDLTRPVIEIYI